MGTGQLYALAEHSGTVKLISFGFASCATHCPLHLATMHGVLDRLGPLATSVEVLFVSIDPQRETAPALGKFLGGFDPRIEGLRVEGPALEQLVKAYEVSAVRRALEVPMAAAGADPLRGYTIDHSAFTVLVDGAGRLRVRFTAQADADEMASVVAKVVNAANGPQS